MADLHQYLKSITASAPYAPVTYWGHRGNTLSRWLISSTIVNKDSLIDTNPYPDVKARVLSEKEANSLPQEQLESNWRYYISDHKESFYRLNSPEKLFSGKYDKAYEKLIYCTCCILCRSDVRTIFHIAVNMPAPMRLWINGELVFTGTIGYFRKNHILSFILREGANTVLVERRLYPDNRMLSICPKFFTISTIPYDSLLSDKTSAAFIDDKTLNWSAEAYTITPDKAFYKSGEPIKLIVLPKCFEGKARQQIKASIISPGGKILKTLICNTSEVQSVIIGNEVSGALRISAKSIDGHKKAGDIYIFIGDYNDKCRNLIEGAARRGDSKGKISDNFREITKIININTGFVRDSSELAHESIYYQVFRHFYRLEGYMKTDDAGRPGSLQEIYGRSFIDFERSSIDEGFISYGINLPKGFNTSNKYPLIVYFMFDDNLIRYPVHPYRTFRYEPDNAVILSLSARGDFSRDFINEIGIIRIIAKAADEYCIDRDRIHLIGICTGARRGFDLAMKLPDLFASITACSGAIVVDSCKDRDMYIRNIENTAVNQLYIADDSIYNGISIESAADRLPLLKGFAFQGFEHEGFIDLFNTPKLLKRALRQRKNKYPEKVRFVSYDPVYSKSYWLQIEGRENICKAACIEGEVQNQNRICISTRNINRFSMLLNRNAMGLDNNIEISINAQSIFCCLEDYCVLRVNIGSEKINIESICCTEEQLEERYSSIYVDESLLGIKQIFMDSCIVIKEKQETNQLINDFYRILLQPLKAKARSYKYTLVNEIDFEAGSCASGNHIYVAAIDNINERHRGILASAGIKISEKAFVYKERKCIGDFFAFIKSRNPYNPEKLCLLIVYSSTDVFEEMNSFIRTFDANQIFYGDIVVYSGGSYYSEALSAPQKI